MTLPEDPSRLVPTEHIEQTRKPLDVFLDDVQQNIGILRSRLRQQVHHTLHDLPGMNSTFTGDAYVDSVGTIVRFRRGESDFFYTPHATDMRKNTLDRLAFPRKKFFDGVAAQVPQISRVLNIGAGGDVAPIESFRDAGHEIISTDMAEDTIRMLRSRTGMPAFACDLANIDRVLEPDSVDVVIGNSTLGYLDPSKMKKVVENLVKIMKHGGVFSFDLMPHPHYFELLDEKKERTIVNNSAPDPYKLLEFIEQYGPENGVSAMSYYSYYRSIAINLAVVDLLKKEFESHGLQCTTGSQHFTGEEGMKTPCLTLRVTKDRPELLEPLEGERLYDDSLDQLRNETKDGKPYLLLGSLDRVSGEKLAKVFHIRCDRRSAPWLVAQHIANTQDLSSFPDAIKNEVIEKMNPGTYATNIRPYVEGKEFVEPKPLPSHIAADQVFHKLVIHGEAPFGPEEADRRIDAAYAAQELKHRDQAERERQRQLLEKQKERRAKEKAKKKQNRR